MLGVINEEKFKKMEKERPDEIGNGRRKRMKKEKKKKNQEIVLIYFFNLFLFYSIFKNINKQTLYTSVLWN